MSSAAARNDASAEGPSARRYVTQVASLDALVGAHPDALASIFAAGRAADPAELGDVTQGRLLALSDQAGLFLALRPVLRALGGGLLPWKGKSFDHGGNSGQNIFPGRRAFRFRAEVGPSSIDGRPALRLTYGDPAHRNPWPINAFVDELRTAGPRIAVGPASLGGRTLFWFGLEATRD